MKEGAVAVLGLWHLGSVYSACLAELGYEVVGIDAKEQIAESLGKGTPPVDEPGLSELLKKNSSEGRLSLSSDFGSLSTCEYAILALDTPVDDLDRPNLKPVFALARKAAPYLCAGCHVIISSQVPVGTCERLARAMNLRGTMTISYVPENLRLGDAIPSFFSPPMLVIGSDTKEGLGSTAKLFGRLKTEVITMPLRAAETVKHVLNSYLALNISFGNEVAELCRSLKVDPSEVMRAVMKDPRVSPKAPMKPGPPFSGGTLARDLNTLRSLGRSHKVRTSVLDGAARANSRRKVEIVGGIVSILGRAPRGSTVAVLGLTYKAGTDTLRRSLSLEMVKRLRSRGIRVRAYDPKVKHVPDQGLLDLRKDAYDAVKGADVTVIFTPWPEFASLDCSRIRAEVKKPLVLDLPHVLDGEKAEAAGLRLIEV